MLNVPMSVMYENLKRVYDHLKDQYDLTFTNTFAVDDGFTEDIPVLCGTANNLTFWLYIYDFDDEFVFSYEVPGEDYHNHTHPQNFEEAVEIITEFMEGTL